MSNGLWFDSKAFFRKEVVCDLNIPQPVFCDMKKVLLVENRNHVWRDLFRLVDGECKKWPVV